ncbi:hypothetical protein QD712_23215 [Streptomyces acidiscabies]|uniref:hypothetical protein n=1 Tax=Streptomyces acidiscabies TaxID=42234 RepID=UPI0030CB6122
MQAGEQLDAACKKCADYERQQEQDALRLRSARREAARLQATVADLKAERAGLRERLAAAETRALLPVPRPPRDRRQSTKDSSVARQLATQAAELNSAGHEGHAFTLIRQSTAEVLTPAETAQVVVELRLHPGGDRLADDLIHVYGRDQEKRDVMAVAMGLHDEGAADDAGAILRAALRPRAGSTKS